MIRTVESTTEAHERVRQSFRGYAAQIQLRRRSRSGYLSELVRRYRFHVEPGSRVLELGVGTGDLLASMASSRAVGIDVSPEMLAVARAEHPNLELYECSAESLDECVQGPFDYIILSDLTVFLYDIQMVLAGLQSLCHSRTRVIFNFHSRLWQPVLNLLAAFGLHHRHVRTNWVTVEDITNLLMVAEYNVIATDRSTLIPAHIPILSTLANRYLARLPVLSHFCLVNWVIARPQRALGRADELSASIVCPCRNEAGNIPNIVRRTPRLGSLTEIIFVEGGSTDGTWDAIQREVAAGSPNRVELRAYKQAIKGKADAVRTGFLHATGDILMILDADLTVPPEDLAAFFDALTKGKGEFINGSRLVYPMTDDAMRFLNLIGNKFFARVFSYLLAQPIKDTLCGTKALARSDYERITRGRTYFGEFDPFGDFDLLFGASKLHLKIIEIPVRYRGRTYGETQIRRFRDGLLLLQMCWFGLKRLKLI